MNSQQTFSFDLLKQLFQSRRTVRRFTDDPVDESVILDLIEAAIWAPNHRMTEPWRFYVLSKSGERRKQIARLTHDWVLANVQNPNPERARASAEAAQKELLDAPALIYVFSLPGDSDEVTEENYSATSCAVQNLMLAAHAKGLGVGWSTGKPCRSEKLAETLGADPASKIVGCLYIGYPATTPTGERSEVSHVTEWL